MKKSNYKFKIFIFLCVLIESIMMMLFSVANKEMVIVYGNFLIEILLIAMMFINHSDKLSLKKDWLILSFTLIQILMYAYTSIKYDITFFDLHKLIMCLGMIYISVYSIKDSYCSFDKFKKALNVILAVAILSTLYNFIINISYFRIHSLRSILLYSWNFHSFFPTRAIYGTFVSISAMICLYLSEENIQKRVQWIVYFWLLANVIITGARAQIIAIIVGSTNYLFYSKRYKKIAVLILVIGLAYFFFTGTQNFENFTETYYMLFDHSVGRDTDITTGRLDLWLTALNNMDIINILFGNGIGSKDTIMAQLNTSILGSRLSSFHSGYIDLFFETGILGICIWVLIIIKTIKKINENCPRTIRNLLWSFILIILVSNLFDSCYLPFTTDTMSPFSSFIVIALPTFISNYYKKEKLRNENFIQLQ